MSTKKYTISDRTPTRVAAHRRAMMMHRELSIATTENHEVEIYIMNAMYYLHHLVSDLKLMLRVRGIK